MILALAIFSWCLLFGAVIGSWFYIGSLERENQYLKDCLQIEKDFHGRWFNQYMELKNKQQQREPNGRFKGVK